MRKYRFPHPAEYGTQRAVSVKECPVCHERYQVLQRPIFITTDLGEVILVYKIGQLICDWCLTQNCRKMHLKIELG